jgi:hypothetical protein
MTNAFNALHLAQEQIADLDLQLLKRKLRATESPCDTKTLVNGRELKAFCSTDYLISFKLLLKVPRSMALVAVPLISSAATALHMRSLKVSWQIFRSNISQMRVHSFLAPATLLI